MKVISAKPFIKWAGGKQSLASEILAAMPSDFDNYFEPFIGGGSIFFSLLPNKAYLADANAWLIQTYEAIRDDWKRVAANLDKLPNTKEHFLEIRQQSRVVQCPFKRAAFFIYLNKTCFRGLFRVNQRNEFNVPYGDYDRRYYDPENLEAVAESLAHVHFCTSDFELAVREATSDDFIYFDPPYYKQGGHADFNRYTPEQFRSGDHFRLAALCRELDERRVRWLLSNSNTSFVRELFDGYNFTEVSARRDINLKSKRRPISELLISNF